MFASAIFGCAKSPLPFTCSCASVSTKSAGAAELFARAIAAAAEIGEPTADRAARAYCALIDVAAGRARDALDAMHAIHEQTLRHGGSFALPWLEVLLAQAEAGTGALEDARSRLSVLVSIDAWGAAHALAWARVELGEVLRLLGEGDEAARHARRGIESARGLSNTWLIAKAERTLGRLAGARGEWADAERMHHKSLATVWERGYQLELPSAIEALAEVAAARVDCADAARMLGAADRARHDLGFVAWPAERAEADALRARVEDALRAGAFERAHSDGGALSHGDAVAWLRRARGTRKRPPHGWDSLTPTELEVVRYAAAGLTNPQIGERLFIARATVKNHLSHAYAKLDVHNRSQLTASAAGRFPRDAE
jgi:DNA-binding CsgD family transcriptional regulator